MTEHATLAGSAATDRPCKTCHWFAGWVADGFHARCIDKSRRLHIHPQPEQGCVYWVREIGADDANG